MNYAAAYHLRRIALILLMAVSSGTLSAFDLGQNQVNLAFVGGFDHAPLPLKINNPGPGFDAAQLQVSSDSAWVTPVVLPGSLEVELIFTNKALSTGSRTATITASHGGQTVTVYLNTAMSQRSVFKLTADSYRHRVYGLQMSGVTQGAVLVIDPNAGTPVASVSVGNRPTGLTLSADGQELFVINAADQTISVLDAGRLTVKEIISLPVFSNWGVSSTTANIGVGPAGVIYYTDGSWTPVLHVLRRSPLTVLQSVMMEGPGSGHGFGDFCLNPQKTQLFGWGQYGWSAGILSSYISKFTVAANGTLTYNSKSNATTSGFLSRDPLETPVLMDGAGSRLFVKQLAVEPQNVSTTVGSYPNPVYSISPGGEIAMTNNAIYRVSNASKVLDLPVTTTLHAVTADYSRLVYYNPSSRALASLDLMTEVGPEILGRTLTPAEGAITLPPEKLAWSAFNGASSYRVFIGTSPTAVSAATLASPLYLGATTYPEIDAPTNLQAGATYYWRVDSNVNGSWNAGSLHSFTVSSISTSLNKIVAATVAGHENHQVTVGLTSATPGRAWTATADQSWVEFATSSGVTPGNLQVVLNAGNLSPGLHQATITLSDTSGPLLTLPVTLTVEALTLTQIKSDPGSAKVYAISEATTSGAKAYLLELDSQTEKITRVVQVGSSVTDLALHLPENRIYVPNWKLGSLLALNKTTLALEQTYAFTPFTSVGYGDKDVYRVSAGVAGRIVVEEMDQWIDVTLHNTTNGNQLATTFLREGGGAFDPTGRYYFHGENNISNAKISKFDTHGDVFTSLANIRVTSFSYYGSRVVVMSENGNAVFWNGSHFNANLTELWTMSAEVYSTSSNGRLAFGQTKIYDTQTKQAILDMPVSTRVSGYNSTSQKLVVQNGNRVRFYVATIPLTLPAPVMSLGAATLTSLTLDWTDNSLESGFTLQMRPAGGSTWSSVTPSITANQTSRQITGLSADTAYEFRIKADAPSVSSDWSNVLTARTLTPPPPTIEFVSLTATPSSLVLHFTTTNTPTSIRINRATQADGPWQEIDSISGAATSYTDLTAAIGVTHYYRVQALTSSQASAVSHVRSAVIPAPSAAITALEAEPNAIRIQLTTLNSPGFVFVERSLAEEGPFVQVASLSGVVTSHLDKSVQPATVYYYRARAGRGVYLSNYSAIWSLQSPALTAPQTPPSLMIVSRSAAGIVLSWQDLHAESGYVLERRRTIETEWTEVARPAQDATTHADLSVEERRVYSYRLAAFNDAGTSDFVYSANVPAIDDYVVFEDDFDPGIDIPLWAELSTSDSVITGLGVSGSKALHFNHSGIRRAVTQTLNIAEGSRIEFDLRAGNAQRDGASNWDNSEAGESVVLEYTIDGLSWVLIQQFNTQFPALSDWTAQSVSVPVSAVSLSTQFRWRQLANSGAGFDAWAIDNVRIQSPDTPDDVFFLEQPEPSLAIEGSPMSLRVRLSHQGYTYQWFKDGKTLPGATRPVYQLDAVRPMHAGYYHCRVTRGASTAESDPALLAVVQPVGLSTTRRVAEGGAFTLALNVYPIAAAAEIDCRWERWTGADFDAIGVVEGLDSRILKVSQISPGAQGEYYARLAYRDTHQVVVGPYLVQLESAPKLGEIDAQTIVMGSEVHIPIHVDDWAARIRVENLPPGLRLDPAQNTIVGRPSKPMTRLVKVVAYNGFGQSDPVQFPIAVLPFPAAHVGSFTGLIFHGQDSLLKHGGILRLSVSSTGVASLFIDSGARKWRLKTGVTFQPGSNSGVIRAALPFADGTTQYLEIGLEATETAYGGILDAFEVQVANVVVTPNAQRLPHMGTLRYNACIIHYDEITPTGLPEHSGLLSFLVPPSGLVRWSGRLADGTVVTGQSPASQSAEVSFFQSLYRNRGSLLGSVRMNGTGMDGTVYWSKDDLQGRSRYYGNGFEPVEMGVAGSLYVVPGRNEMPLPDLREGSSNAYLQFFGGVLADTLEQSFTFTANQRAAFLHGPIENPNTMRLNFNSRTGHFSGSFILTDPGLGRRPVKRTANYYGVMLHGEAKGAGFFIAPELPELGDPISTLKNTPMQAGSVNLLPQ